MTLIQLEERIPDMITVAYAQNKAIINYDNGICEHIIMPQRIYSKLEERFLDDLKLRTKVRINPEKKERKRPIISRISKPYDRELIIKMYNEGYQYREIANAIGFALGTISGIIREMLYDGIIQKRTKLKKYDQYIIDNLGKKTMTQIALELGTTKRYIWDRRHRLTKMGIL